MRQYLFTRRDLPAACRLLEVGCGPGVILEEIKAQQVPAPQSPARLPGNQSGLQLYGVDIRLDFLQAYAAENPSAVLSQGDAHLLPYADGVFDLVICHYFLLWVANPLQVVCEMRRVCREGGAIVALAEPDYGGRIDYPQSLHKLGHLQTQALITQGADPEIGRKLRGIFTQAGLSEIETGVLGGQWRGKPPSDEWELEWQVLAHDLGKKALNRSMAGAKSNRLPGVPVRQPVRMYPPSMLGKK